MDIINAFNEFGFLLWYHIPIAYDLHLKGQLGNTNSKIGTKSIFYFSEKHTESGGHIDTFRFSQECYKHDTPNFAKQNWTPPPLNEYYSNNELVFDKPILTINNKNNTEWSTGKIFNFFNKESLDNIFAEFYETHQIIYLRPVGKNNKVAYQHDSGQEPKEIGDIDLINDKYPEVLWIGDMLSDEYSGETYNELQFKILANSDQHISCAGDASVPSYFGGDVLIYGHPQCNSTNRGVWKTDSWLKLLSGANIYGFTDYNELLTKAITLWK